MTTVILFKKQSGNYSICSGTTNLGAFESAESLFEKIQEIQKSEYQKTYNPQQLITAEYSQSQTKKTFSLVTLKDCQRIFKAKERISK